jgi:hypothetical protein
MTKQTEKPGAVASILSPVAAVLALVPRWLVVAVGVLVVAWLGFELYGKAITTFYAIKNAAVRLENEWPAVVEQAKKEREARESAEKASGKPH